jgi:PQQ-dependent catabolism-associated CXXCW motif protein
MSKGGSSTRREGGEMIARTVVVLAVVVLAVACGFAIRTDAAETPPEPAGYRVDTYHAPTPLTIAGNPAIGTDEARRLWEAGAAIFIDVVAAARRPPSLPAGAIWSPTPHLDIPGSSWLPDGGRGALSPQSEAWLRASLARLVSAKPDAPLIFYCRADCWMSWNATKRALEWGYRGALWYRDGTDGWREAALPLAEAQPPDDMP